jgi:ABC-2 type transport system ATP-binding protein
MAELLTVEGLGKSFEGRRALDAVSFKVLAGEVLGLIGPNGAGKTTLFECVSGLMAADGGAVGYRGKSLPASGRKEALFYLPDGITPWAQQTVGWALSFFAGMYGGDGRPDERLKLDPFRGARIGTLSKGERKRLLLALALNTPHPLLMLDEPFDGLDLRQTRDVMALLREHAGRGRTLMLSIHQLVDAGRVCDRLVLLSDGRVVGEGSVPELRGRAGLAEGGVEEIFLALT